MSPSTLLFQYFNLTTFLLLESGCKGIGFSNTSQTYLPFSFNKNETFFITYWFINAFRVNNFGKREKRENNYTLYIYACARRTRRKRIKTFHKYAGLGGAGSVKIVAASKQGHCFTHSSGSISPLCINRKTFCATFSNHFVSFLELLTQNELRKFIRFSGLFKHLSKTIKKHLKSYILPIFV